MKKSADIFGVVPEIGDLVAYNPPYYKGLIYGECVGFVASGLPELLVDRKKFPGRFGQLNINGFYTPKTGFIVNKNKDGKD